MKLEDQVYSLELSRILQELEIKQESLFYWAKDFYHESFDIYYRSRYSNTHENGISAFTQAELGEMLPANIIHCSKDGDKWCVLMALIFKKAMVNLLTLRSMPEPKCLFI